MYLWLVHHQNVFNKFVSLSLPTLVDSNISIAHWSSFNTWNPFRTNLPFSQVFDKDLNSLAGEIPTLAASTIHEKLCVHWNITCTCSICTNQWQLLPHHCRRCVFCSLPSSINGIRPLSNSLNMMVCGLLRLPSLYYETHMVFSHQKMESDHCSHTHMLESQFFSWYISQHCTSTQNHHDTWLLCAVDSNTPPKTDSHKTFHTCVAIQEISEMP